MLSSTGHFAVRRVDDSLPERAAWKREPRLRRATPLARFMAEAAVGACGGRGGAAGVRRGLVAVFCTGPIVASRKFFEGVLDHGHGLASPALFPETVYNSPTSHVAALLGLDGPVYSLVGDESAWVEALDVAGVWLANGEVDEVVVVAGEELDPIAVEAFRAAGWLRRGARYLPAEGAAAVRVRLAVTGEPWVEVAAMPRGFSNAAECRAVGAAMVRGLGAGGLMVPTALGTWAARIEAECFSGWAKVECSAAVRMRAFSATLGWVLVEAWERGLHSAECVLPVWGLNHAVGALRLGSGPASRSKA